MPAHFARDRCRRCQLLPELAHHPRPIHADIAESLLHTERGGEGKPSSEWSAAEVDYNRVARQTAGKKHAEGGGEFFYMPTLKIMCIEKYAIKGRKTTARLVEISLSPAGDFAHRAVTLDSKRLPYENGAWIIPHACGDLGSSKLFKPLGKRHACHMSVLATGLSSCHAIPKSSPKAAGGRRQRPLAVERTGGRPAAARPTLSPRAGQAGGGGGRRRHLSTQRRGVVLFVPGGAEVGSRGKS